MLYPMFAMVLLTIGFMAFTAYYRVKSVNSGEINPSFFKGMAGYDIPQKLHIQIRHFTTLTETPPLFFAACILFIVMGIQNQLAIIIAWGYVVSRIVHLYIHLGYNHPLHRMLAFAFGLLCILALWLMLVFNQT